MVVQEKLDIALREARKTRLSAQALGAICDEMDRLIRALGPRPIAQEITHELEALRACAVVGQHLVEHLRERVDTVIEIPDRQGRNLRMRVQKVEDDRVTVVHPSGGQADLPWDGLDAAWVARTVNDNADDPTLGLFLARAQRWEEAHRHFMQSGYRHPLAMEAAERAAAAIAGRANTAIVARKWEDALAVIADFKKLFPDEAGPDELRKSVLNSLVASATKDARDKKKSSAEKTIALILKHFPEEKDLVEEIRFEMIPAGTWIPVDDPSLFGMPGKKGEGIVLAPGPGSFEMVTLRMPKGKFDAVSARISLGGETGILGGLVFEMTGPREYRELYLDPNTGWAVLGKFDQGVFKEDQKVRCSTTRDREITVLISRGEYIVQLDGREIMKKVADHREITGVALHLSYGTATFDRIRLRKK